jgi:hypothetical protein
MKNIQQLFATVILTLALACVAFAGDIPGGKAPGDIPGGLSATGDIPGGLAVTLSILSRTF